MNTFLCILKADIRRFWSMCWKFYMVFYIYCIFQAVSYFSNVYRCIKNSRISSISLGDSLLYVFRGAKEFSPGMQIDIPLFEILIVLYITFIITYYITTDQKAVGKNILVISGSASGWWLSKYITMLLAVIIYMAGIFAANTIVGLIMTGSRFSMSLNITGTEAEYFYRLSLNLISICLWLLYCVLCVS